MLRLIASEKADDAGKTRDVKLKVWLLAHCFENRAAIFPTLGAAFERALVPSLR